MTTDKEAKALAKRDSIIAAFLERKADIDAKLARLTAASAEHFGTNPDHLTWGDVGDLDRLDTLLQQATDQVFREGENGA